MVPSVASGALKDTVIGFAVHFAYSVVFSVITV